MAAQRMYARLTRQEYLEQERCAPYKSEYHNGVVVAMAGASPEHSTIGFNVGTELGIQLKGTPCRGLDNDSRVYVPACNKYYYPDKTVVCGEPQYETVAGLRSLLNPTLIVEVLSDSTERSDRRDKFDCYGTLTSLHTYVMIAQDEPRIERYSRQEGGSWEYEVARGLDATLTLLAIGCQLRLADVYVHVTFPPPANVDIEAVANDAAEH